jgi:hypothetical protein
MAAPRRPAGERDERRAKTEALEQSRARIVREAVEVDVEAAQNVPRRRVVAHRRPFACDRERIEAIGEPPSQRRPAEVESVEDRSQARRRRDDRGQARLTRRLTRTERVGLPKAVG